jgi:hypothetical protein
MRIAITLIAGVGAAMLRQTRFHRRLKGLKQGGVFTLSCLELQVIPLSLFCLRGLLVVGKQQKSTTNLTRFNVAPRRLFSSGWRVGLRIGGRPNR